ncbi:hypothetical protein E4U52_008252 [Claviceps spartinae]|nr:hypothetical protein E4U52_008252 [Claviceps spartinae]
MLTVDEPMHVEVRGLEHVAALRDTHDLVVARQPHARSVVVVIITDAIVTYGIGLWWSVRTMANGRVKEAIERLKRILAIRKTMQADPFLSTAAQYIFAKAYRAGRRAKEAIKPLERVLALSRNGTPQQWSNKEADGVTSSIQFRDHPQYRAANIVIASRLLILDDTTKILTSSSF